MTPSGSRLFVYSPTAGALAELDTKSLEISRTGSVPPPLNTPPSTVRATATQSTLYLSVSNQVAAVALDDMTAGEWNVAPGEISGIEPASDDHALYLVLVDRVLVVDPRTFTPRRTGGAVGVGARRPRGTGAPADPARLHEVRLLIDG